MYLKNIVSEFLPHASEITLTPIESGLINTTWVVEANNQKFILQKINTKVFKNPDAISNNHLAVNTALESSDYSKIITKPLLSENGNYYAKDSNDNYWRMQKFVENSVTYTKVPNPEIAYKAAQCFSEFYKTLNKNKIPKLQEVLPNFINFEKRIFDYQQALENADEVRKIYAKNEIEFVNENLQIPEKWISLQKHQLLPERIIHADPKISNILFDENQDALAVIDLDTVMTSTLLYDFGDMIRSYTNLAEEDDAEFTDNFSPEIYDKVKEGFLFHLKDILTETEIKSLDYASQVIIYIQAVRFLTDYLNGDTYYSTSREHHNLDRTKNQIQLLKNLMKNLY